MGRRKQNTSRNSICEVLKWSKIRRGIIRFSRQWLSCWSLTKPFSFPLFCINCQKESVLLSIDGQRESSWFLSYFTYTEQLGRVPGKLTKKSRPGVYLDYTQGFKSVTGILNSVVIPEKKCKKQGFHKDGIFYWTNCVSGKETSFRVPSSLPQVMSVTGILGWR